VNLKIHHFALPLRHPFTISRGTTTLQQTLVVELTDGNHHGYGEATANPYYGATLESMSNSLEAVRMQIETLSWEEPESLWKALEEPLGADRFAQCALDQAAHDLWGKRLGQPVYRLWGLKAENLPRTSFTIGIDTLDKMVEKLGEMPDWPIYKIKLGTSDDVAIVRRLREHTGATFRVDANAAWGVDEALSNARQLEPLGVEFIEQPLDPANRDGMQELLAQSPLPLIADESCVAENDVSRCAGCFHGVNIKLVKCGGLTPARRMIDQARRLGLKTMVGCMTESTVGISAIAQLLPLLDYVDMDGALLLSEDIATGVSIDRGQVRMADAMGTGVQLRPSASEAVV
jgi:L-alanine-DL-glutamate epimerase-like enolase superfamily enzyme